MDSNLEDHLLQEDKEYTKGQRRAAQIGATLAEEDKKMSSQLRLLIFIFVILR